MTSVSPLDCSPNAPWEAGGNLGHQSSGSVGRPEPLNTPPSWWASSLWGTASCLVTDVYDLTTFSLYITGKKKRKKEKNLLNEIDGRAG